jgi:putative nucleotidyltransferase with HDIG domain
MMLNNKQLNIYFFSFLRSIRKNSARILLFSICLLSLSLIICLLNPKKKQIANLQDLKLGSIAPKTLYSNRTISYIDEEASFQQQKDLIASIPPVYRRSTSIDAEIHSGFLDFIRFYRQELRTKNDFSSFKKNFEIRYPQLFTENILNLLFTLQTPDYFVEETEKLLDRILNIGIIGKEALHQGNYTGDTIEIQSEGQKGRFLAKSALISSDRVSQYIAEEISNASYPASFKELAHPVIKPFLIDNILFSPEKSLERQNEAKTKLTPILKHIDRDEHIIKKGFPIGEEEMLRVQALIQAEKRRIPADSIGRIAITLVFMSISYVFLFHRDVGLKSQVFKESEIKKASFLALFFLIYLFLARLTSVYRLPIEGFVSAILLPQNLFIMLIAIFLGNNMAFFMALILPILGFIVFSLDFSSCFFAFLTSFISIISIKNITRRIEFVRAAIILSLVGPLLMLPILLVNQTSLGNYPLFLASASANGLVYGFLLLGVLPLFEFLFNANTDFRLMELADLNSPLLKKLLATAPGTYSHSVTVANLADAAAKEVGANSLLARVGAYYHDIGKADQPEWFSENQVFYNKHDDISPRLSVAVIRSHLKTGVEKARQARLPESVIDIIAEHHGNSVIAYFYQEALKKDSQVNAEDYSYPGTLPRSRESTIVMLADGIEASVRSIKHPTVPRLEKQIKDYIDKKIKLGQLANSELTIRELEMVASAFSRVLAGHYHSRIEYPKEVLKNE